MEASSTNVFFGYPSRPGVLRETLVSAAAKIGRLGSVECKTWEAIDVTGRLIIDQILLEITNADVGIYELTDLNHNVMFEIGYAIAIDRPIWIVRDPTNIEGERLWREVGTLTTTGYSKYSNSDEIAAAFISERPDLQGHRIFSESLAPALDTALRPSVFYLASLYNSDANRGLARRIDQERENELTVVTADPRESAGESLQWFAQQAITAAAVIAHFESPAKVGAGAHNARTALVAGLAHGMRRPLLMLGPHDYVPPIDYRDLLFVYDTAQSAEARTDRWLRGVLEQHYEDISRRRVASSRRSRATELRTLKLGEHLAENEEATLGDYFVETASYHEVLSSKTAIFVGRKGVGKTANLLQAAEQLRSDRRQLVCVIRPYGYDVQSVLRLMRLFSERDERGYAVEALWKYLIYSEIALTAASEVVNRPAAAARDASEEALTEYLDGNGSFVTADFGVRIERAIATLAETDLGAGVETRRSSISEALHSGVLRDLRRLIGGLLRQRTRIAVLVDNIDKGWEDEAEYAELAPFVLGLLSAVRRIEEEFAHERKAVEAVPLTLAVFLRSDIFDYVSRAARESDKVPVARLSWEDPKLLLQVVEERYAAILGDENTLPEEFWEKYFCSTVDGIDVKDYLIGRILHRPRDLVYMCNSALAIAGNRRNETVQPEDLREAEGVYSRFAFDVLLVENSGEFGSLQDILYGFLGEPAVMGSRAVSDALAVAGVPSDDQPRVIAYLRSLAFLGVEVRAETFDFAEEPRDRERADALAARLASKTGSEVRYAIHPAFRPYLEIADRQEIAGQIALSD
jgi:hypothetical protein